ncbi:hypothetical protein GW17_00056508 [Ensete ventricosum]|nr:hypothetical protein GW17_00056508 [Ensete ventricosum]
MDIRAYPNLYPKRAVGLRPRSTWLTTCVRAPKVNDPKTDSDSYPRSTLAVGLATSAWAPSARLCKGNKNGRDPLRLIIFSSQLLHINYLCISLQAAIVNSIRVGTGTNIQDNSLVHVAKSNLSGKVLPTIIGDNVTVG